MTSGFEVWPSGSGNENRQGSSDPGLQAPHRSCVPSYAATQTGELVWSLQKCTTCRNSAGQPLIGSVALTSRATRQVTSAASREIDTGRRHLEKKAAATESMTGTLLPTPGEGPGTAAEKMLIGFWQRRHWALTGRASAPRPTDGTWHQSVDRLRTASEQTHWHRQRSDRQLCLVRPCR